METIKMNEPQDADVGSTTVMDAESTLVSNEQAPIKLIQDLNQHSFTSKHGEVNDALRIIPYVASPKRHRKSSSKKHRKRKEKRKRITKASNSSSQADKDTKLFHGIVIGSFIGAALTEFVLDKLK